jgi:hypothetical protein
MGSWRNGSATEWHSVGYEFESRRLHRRKEFLMYLVILFGALILFARFMGDKIGDVTLFGVTFGVTVVVTAMLLPLRDAIHQIRGRRYVLLTIFLAGTIIYVFFPTIDYPELQLPSTMAYVAALVWMELVDSLFYAIFRRWGWGPGVVISDLVAAPLLAIVFIWLIFGELQSRGLTALVGYDSRWEWTWDYIVNGDLLAKYLTLVVIYVILFTTNLPTRMSGLPMFKRADQEVQHAE